MRTLHGLAFVVSAFAVSVRDAQQTGSYAPGRGLSPIAILRIKSVHNELKATPEQARKLDDLSDATIKMYRREGGIPTRGLSSQEIRAKALELGRVREEALRKDLTAILKPEQLRRFEQIAVQQAGIFAFQSHRAREALKLTEHQKAQLQAIDLEMKEALGAATSAYSKDRQGAAAGLLAVRTQILVKYLALLTDEQKATWNDLNGEPFVIVVE